MGAAAVLMVCASLTVVDGDTVKCDGQLLRDMGDGAPNVSGYDTAEIGPRAKCVAEQQAGEQAAARMRELIATPGLTIENSGKRDVYDRPLVVLRLPDGTTIGHHMIEEGYARVWTPGYVADWCSG